MNDLPSIFYAAIFAVVLLFALFLMTLGGLSLFAPAKAKAFLLGFAGSAATHFLEMTLRLLVGVSLVLQAPYLEYPAAFKVFGWMMIGTTLVLLLLPWKLHRRFAEKAVPQALQYLPLVGIVSLALGTALLIFLARD
jgi:hypothetical protein